MSERPKMPLRVRGWPERLAEVVEAARAKPFCWGSHDCAMFAGQAVEAITGRNPFAAWRGAYASEREADEIMEAQGGPVAMLERVMLEFGAAEIQPAIAQRGDLALVVVGNVEAVGVVLANGVAVPGPEGLQIAPLRCVRRAWAV